MGTAIFFASLSALSIFIWLLSLLSARLTNEKLITWANLWKFLEVGGLWAAAGVGVWAILSSTQDAHEQRDILINQQRPWVSAELPSPTGPLRLISSDWAMLDTIVRIKNTGKSPARHVTIFLKLVGLPRSADVLAELERLCPEDPTPSPLIKGQRYLEMTLFPGDAFDIPVMASALKDDLEQMRASNTVKHAYVSAVIGCVRYRYASDERSHRTGIILNLRRTAPTPSNSIDLDADGPISPTQLSLSYSILGSGPAD